MKSSNLDTTLKDLANIKYACEDNWQDLNTACDLLYKIYLTGAVDKDAIKTFIDRQAWLWEEVEQRYKRK